MAAKQEDSYKAQYKNLVKLNKRLKYICDVYYIDYNGYIYMHSLESFIEKFAVCLPDCDVSLYQGIMYLPNQFATFTKDAKLTKLIISDNPQSIDMGQSDSDISIKLNKIYIPDKTCDETQILNNTVIPQMYFKLHTLLSEIRLYHFIDIPEDMINDIINNKMISFRDTDSGMYIPISKNIFPCIKEGDSIKYTILPLKDDQLKEKKYVLFKKETPEMIIYTIIAYYNII